MRLDEGLDELVFTARLDGAAGACDVLEGYSDWIPEMSSGSSDICE
jgi:hypothetical protein